MKRLAQDSWIQLFAFLALLSGGMTAYGLMASPAPPAPQAATAPAPAAHDPPRRRLFSDKPLPSDADPKADRMLVRLASSREKSLADVLERLRNPAPPPGPGGAAPSVTGAGVQRVIAPKKPGRWIVDARLGKDADTAKLGDAVFSAKDGDVIELRPGSYQESVAITRPLTIVGTGASAKDVVIESAAPMSLISLAGAKMTLKNLSLVVRAAFPGRGVNVSANGEAVLENVDLSAPAGGGGLVVLGAKATLRGSRIGPCLVGVAGDDARLSVENTTIEGCTFGVQVSGTRIRATRARITGSAQAAMVLFKGSEAELEGARFNGNDVGLALQGGSRARSDRGDFTGNRRQAYLESIDTSLSGRENRPPFKVVPRRRFVPFQGRYYR